MNNHVRIYLLVHICPSTIGRPFKQSRDNILDYDVSFRTPKLIASVYTHGYMNRDSTHQTTYRLPDFYKGNGARLEYLSQIHMNKAR